MILNHCVTCLKNIQNCLLVITLKQCYFDIYFFPWMNNLQHDVMFDYFEHQWHQQVLLLMLPKALLLWPWPPKFYYFFKSNLNLATSTNFSCVVNSYNNIKSNETLSLPFTIFFLLKPNVLFLFFFSFFKSTKFYLRF